MSAPVVRAFPNGSFAQNAYLVADPATRDAVLVDPGEDTRGLLAAARDWRVREIWLTHGHIDHVLGVPAARTATGAPVRLHPLDRALYDGVPQQALWLLGTTVAPLAPPELAFVAGEAARVGTLAFEVRHVPGHSPGSVALVGHGLVLGGDVLFAGSIGRTDLPGGDFDTLLDSIARELLTLPDDTAVHPGHGPATTIGAERRTNPFLAGAARGG